jgi:dCMP deaminase
MRPTRDEYYLREAELVASRSTCIRRSVGCVLVDAHGRELAKGYNGVASGRSHCNEGFPCPGASGASGKLLDACEAIHAEQNAILHLRDAMLVDTVYLTVSPCVSCIKLLLGTSARRIVCRELYPHPEALRWWAEAGRELVVLERKDQ